MPDQKPKIKNQKSKAGAEKPVVKVLKPVVKKKVEAVKVSKAVSKSPAPKANLTVSVYGLDGTVSGKMTLEAAIFGEKVNKKLLAQAVRVYQANKRQGNASTKTRGEVEGSTRKIYRQKGTGNARHGSVRAPIFVKGGIVHGPKPKDFNLELPKKMRRKALFSALSAKLADEEIKVLAGLGTMEPKTKLLAAALKKLAIEGKKNRLLLVIPDDFENAHRAVGNLEGVVRTSAARLNALDVLKNKNLLFAKEAISELEKVFLSKN